MNKQNCECLKSTIKKLEDHLVKNSDNYERESVLFTNIPIITFSGEPIPFMVASYQKVGIKKKYEVNINFNNCPFCGTSYEAKEAGT